MSGIWMGRPGAARKLLAGPLLAGLMVASTATVSAGAAPVPTRSASASTVSAPTRATLAAATAQRAAAAKAAAAKVAAAKKAAAAAAKQAAARAVAARKAAAARQATAARASRAAARVTLGKRAVTVAAAQRGKPYVWGASGPSGFDCSGLVQYVYEDKLGVDVPRTATAQKRAATPVAKRSMRPGDLVFFTEGRRIYHVGIYAGAGKVWHAPRPGQRVELSKIWTSKWVAGRP